MFIAKVNTRGDTVRTHRCPVGLVRKLFGYRYFESVTNLQHALGRPTWEELVQRRQDSFISRARSCDPVMLVGAFC